MSPELHSYVQAQWEIAVYAMPVILVAVAVAGLLAWVYQKYYND